MTATCINAVGYEGRLTEGKTYDWQAYDREFATVTFDDGTMAAVFTDRFEIVQEPIVVQEVCPGDRCLTCKDGTWDYPPVENCTCHMGNPPCGQCTSQLLECNHCGLNEEDVGPKPEKSLEEGGLCDCGNGTWHVRGPDKPMECDYCGAKTWGRDR
jgi:hypothetical protein